MRKMNKKIALQSCPRSRITSCPAEKTAVEKAAMEMLFYGTGNCRKVVLLKYCVPAKSVIHCFS